MKAETLRRAKAGDENAKWSIILEMRKVVRALANKFAKWDSILSADDLETEGLMVVHKAIEHFDPTISSASNFFGRCVYRQLKKLVEKNRPAAAGVDTERPCPDSFREAREDQHYETTAISRANRTRFELIAVLALKDSTMRTRSTNAIAKEFGVSWAFAHKVRQEIQGKIGDKVSYRTKHGSYSFMPAIRHTDRCQFGG